MTQEKTWLLLVSTFAGKDASHDFDASAHFRGNGTLSNGPYRILSNDPLSNVGPYGIGTL